MADILNRLINDAPVLNQGELTDINKAINLGKKGTNALFNPTAPGYINNVMNNYYQKATGALNAKAAPPAPTFNTTGFNRASANALGGNVRTPQVETNYQADASKAYNQTFQSFTGAQKEARDAINMIKDPTMANAITMSYMTPMLQDYLQYLGKKYGYDYTKTYEQVMQNYQNVQDFNQEMNTLFGNYLSLKYNLPSDLNAAIKTNQIAGANP